MFFGTITHEQLIWHFRNYESLQYVDRNWLSVLTTFFRVIVIYSTLLFIFCLLAEKLAQKYKTAFTVYTSLPKIFSLALLTAIGIFLFRHIDIKALIHTNNTPDFIANNYYIPHSADINFSKKKNIILVLVESLENYSYKEFAHVSYIPNLEQLKSSGISLPQMQEVNGSNWTIAAMTSWHFGLPLKTPYNSHRNAYRTKKGFLPNATSIFDILKNNGYELSMVTGSDHRFAGGDILFIGHGNFNILDKHYYIKKGWNLEQYRGFGGEFRDAFVLERANEEFDKLKKKNKPFVLFVETIDTHSPNGFCQKENIHYNDIRDAIIEADKTIYSFFNKIKSKINPKTDVIILIGDHYLMGEHEFLKPVQNRTIYNLFYGSLPDVPAAKKDTPFSALDIAPTLLQCAGARWGNGKFGLGVSIFSDEKTLLEIYGRDKLNELIGNKSQKYNMFY